MALDPAIAAVLLLADGADTSISRAHSSGGASAAQTATITSVAPDGSTRKYFVKTASGTAAEAMFAGEYASLQAIHNAVPGLCPQPFGQGAMAQTPGAHFLVTDYLDTRPGGRRATSSAAAGPPSLAQKLAQLHTTPAPVPEGFKQPQFGFPVATCCGDTKQDNTYTSSWSTFYADRRLRFIAREAVRRQGNDQELAQNIEQTCVRVVPRLLGEDHLGRREGGIKPVVVHGDLWSGNASRGRLRDGPDEDVVFDSSACYAHSEFELGIMRMFGGFGGLFMREYHGHVPKTDPENEYEDRVRLYELYHHLNHYAMFGGSYRGGAMSIMKTLLGKYGGKAEL